MKKSFNMLLSVMIVFVLVFSLVSCGKKYISGTYRATITETMEAVVVFKEDGTMEQTIISDGEEQPVQHYNYRIKNNKIRIWSNKSDVKELNDNFVEASDAAGNYIKYGGFKYYQEH